MAQTGSRFLSSAPSHEIRYATIELEYLNAPWAVVKCPVHRRDIFVSIDNRS